MKRFFFIFLALASIAVVLDSCMTEAQSTPELYYGAKLFRTNGPSGRDTLRLNDSLQIGDSLLWPLAFYTRFNTLTSATASADKEAYSYWFSCDSNVVAVLTEASKPEEGVLCFQEGFSMIPVTFCFVPKKSGRERITFVVVNTAKQDFSSRSFAFDFIVK